ncbi:hypothetical protein C0J52_21521 [Blattella germanica]|nr:hypothetical protein C0J52_21521 [Blattella germanica]
MSRVPLSELKQNTRDAISTITKDDWIGAIRHVNQISDDYWTRDGLLEEELDRIIINVGIDSTDESSDDEIQRESATDSSATETADTSATESGDEIEIHKNLQSSTNNTSYKTIIFLHIYTDDEVVDETLLTDMESEWFTLSPRMVAESNLSGITKIESRGIHVECHFHIFYYNGWEGGTYLVATLIMAGPQTHGTDYREFGPSIFPPLRYNSASKEQLLHTTRSQLNPPTCVAEESPCLYSSVLSSITSIEGQTTVVESLAMRSNSGSNHPGDSINN